MTCKDFDRKNLGEYHNMYVQSNTLLLADVAYLLADINMSLMIEKDIRGRICHAIHRYVKANNK